MNKLIFDTIAIGFQSNTRFHNVPAIILEVSGCNLKCMDKNDPTKACKYIFDHRIYSVKEAKKLITDNTQINHIVIRGGEPLIYKEELEKMLDEIWRDDMYITIHTNGTLPILNPLGRKFHIELYIVNLSEKNIPEPGTKVVNPYTNKDFIFGTTDIENIKETINIDNIRNICLYSKDYLLYFQSNTNNVVDYSEKILKQICDTGDEQLNLFLQKYSPYKHIVYSAINEEQVDEMKFICFKTGRYYNE